MGQAEYKIFIVLATLILLVFIGGIIVFIFQYHKRKLMYEKEKAILNEQYLQDLLNTKLEIQQQTMEDIGREIHDNVGQHLTLASIYANHLAFEGVYPEISQQVTSISNILNESLAELRKLSKSLTNTSAEYAELKDLIDNECARVNALNMCKVKYHYTDTNFRISATVKNFIQRIIQEFLQNSLKHANCKNITHEFQYNDVGLSVRANDDGNGISIDTHGENPNKGKGLPNMKKRAELIGADFSFDSVPGKGTSLKIFIPTKQLYTS